jgi:acyl transferase domain-containing protein
MSDRTEAGVAIVGMACVFPGAPDVDRFASNLDGGVDAITDVPFDRWGADLYDPSADSSSDRLYCKRGGFIESPFAFDAAGLGVMPVAAEGAEPDQLLALATAARALADAGRAGERLARDRVSVVLGRGGYLTAGLARLDQRVRGAEELVRSLRVLAPSLTDADLATVKAEYVRRLGPYGPDTAIGLVPNLAASRIANRLDLRGPAYTVDAACASSLVAVHQACRDLRDGTSDLAIAGGVHICHDPTLWSVFCRLGALSRAQAIRPFDLRADGLLIGEGVGMIVLKRLADALRDEDRVYAVVRGSGVSSDGRAASLMTPSVEGQLLALERAWRASGLDPASLELLEAHGTATPSGDAAEMETLARFFGRQEPGTLRAALGSVKSMIGHAMPAAGIAGLIKAALAIHRGTLLSTLHCEEPSSKLAATRFRILQRTEPWEAATRVAGVNAFGFGGINAHVVLASHGAPAPGRRGLRAHAGADRLWAAAAESPEALARLLEGRSAPALASRVGPCRVALFDPTAERRARAAKIVRRAEPWRGRDDVWFTPRGLLDEGGKIALMFPGVDASFEPRVDDVARAFDLRLPLPVGGGDLKDIGMGIIAVGRIVDAALRALGLAPDAMAGHSIGEWSAMIASEMVPRGAVDPLIAKLAPERVEVPGVVFVAAGAGVARVLPALEGLGSITVSHDNCPHQVILCGRENEADMAVARLVRMGVLCQKLPFRSGYHSPLFADFLGPHRRVLSELTIDPPRVPVWSATTCSPYPPDADEVRRLAVRHLVEPVRFRELTLALYDANVRVFLQAGTGSLPGLVGDTLRGRPHLAMSANVPTRPGMAQLHRVAAALFVEGDAAVLDAFERASPPARPPVAISLSAPIVTLADLAPVAERARPRAAVGAGVLSELDAALDELAGARAEVVEALSRFQRRDALGPREHTFARRLSVDLHPELADHAFYRQPAGWPHLEDAYPLVPMTMLLEIMMDAAVALCPGRVPVSVEAVRALRWLAVAPPVDAKIDAAFDGLDRVDVTIRGYASGVVRVADTYPEPPRADLELLAGAVPAPVTAAELYDGWMFHGPAYRGVLELGPIAPGGIHGELLSLAAKGGLLDNAGQLLGYWVMQHATKDRLAIPVSIGRCRFFGPQPPAGERLSCTVRVRDFGESHVLADVELRRGDRVWASIEGWSDRRFDSDDRTWSVLRFPSSHTIAVVRPEGFAVLAQPWRASASRELLARRYLGRAERAAFAAVDPRTQSGWLLERIAIKDCVRQHLWDRGQGPLFPIEIEISEGPGGPRVRGPFSSDLRVSAAHAGEVAVACVAEGAPAAIAVARGGASDEGAAAHRAVSAARAKLPPDVQATIETARVDDLVVGWTRP